MEMKYVFKSHSHRMAFVRQRMQNLSKNCISYFPNFMVVAFVVRKVKHGKWKFVPFVVDVSFKLCVSLYTHDCSRSLSSFIRKGTISILKGIEQSPL